MMEDVSRSDRDRCLGELLATGGTLQRLACPVTVASRDSLDTFHEPAIAADGRQLFMREVSIPQVLPPPGN